MRLGIIDNSGQPKGEDPVAELCAQLPVSTRILFACYKAVYHFFEAYGNLPKRFKYGFLFFAKFDTFLLKLLTATPDGTRLPAFFLLPRLGKRLEALGSLHEEDALVP